MHHNAMYRMQTHKQPSAGTLRGGSAKQDGSAASLSLAPQQYCTSCIRSCLVRDKSVIRRTRPQPTDFHSGDLWAPRGVESTAVSLTKLSMSVTGRAGRAEGEGPEEGYTQAMDGRSRITKDPSTTRMPGRSTSGFYRPGRHCLHQAP